MKNERQNASANGSSRVKSGLSAWWEWLTSQTHRHPLKIADNDPGPSIIFLHNKIFEASPSLFNFVERLPQYSYRALPAPLEKYPHTGGGSETDYSNSRKNKDVDGRREQKVEDIIRKRYTDKIISSLKWLSDNHETSVDSIPHVHVLLEDLKEYKDKYFTHPYSSFISALYDALVFDDSWTRLKKWQFERICEIIISLNAIKETNYKDIDIAINKLEEIGLDTTPF